MNQKIERWVLGGIAAVFCLYILLRAWLLPVTVDESATAINHVPRLVFDTLTYQLEANPNNHILHTLLIKTFVGIFGWHHFVLRLPVLIGGFLYAWASVQLVRKISDQAWLRVFSLMLLLGNPYLLEFFSLARGYGLAAGLMTVALWHAWRFYESNDTKVLKWAFLFAGLSVYANFTLLIFFAPFVLLMLVGAWQLNPSFSTYWKQAKPAFITLGVFVLLWITPLKRLSKDSESGRPISINDPEVVEAIAAAGAEALVVVAFGQILRDGVLSRWPCINVHFSLLPAYRGAAPVERAIMDGAKRTGVTVMFMEAGLDTGPTISAEATPIGPDEDAGSLVGRLSAIGGPMLVRALDDLEAGRLRSVPQPGDGVSIAPKITAEDRVLDLGRPAEELARRVRALSPHIGAAAAIGGEPFKIWATRARPDVAPAGLSVAEGALVVGCAEGSLEVLELQPPGRGRMDAASFLRGWRGSLDWGGTA